MLKQRYLPAESLLILVILAITTAFTSFANDLITPALPVLANVFQVNAEKMRGTIYTFFIGFGIAHIFWGSLSDILGRRIIMISGILLFVISSIGCIVTTQIEFHLIFRFLQGIGSAAGMILTRAIVRDIYGAERTTRAMSTVFIFFVPITMTMPILGGFLFTHSTWTTAFWIMVTIGILTLVIVSVFLLETAPIKLGNQKHRPFKFSTIKDILSERIFLRNTFSNMFTFASLVIILANLPNVMTIQYGFTPQQNGYMLSAFATSLAVGVLVVRVLAPRFGAQGALYIGVVFAALGWNIILLSQYFASPPLFFSALIACLAAIGTGIVFSLTPGQAMMPFTENAGTASSFYGILQYGGASSIAYISGQFANNQLLPILIIIAACSIASLLNYCFFSHHS